MEGDITNHETFCGTRGSEAAAKDAPSRIRHLVERLSCPENMR